MRRYLGVFTGETRLPKRAVWGSDCIWHVLSCSSRADISGFRPCLGQAQRLGCIFQRQLCQNCKNLFLRDRFSKEFCATILKEGRKCQIRSKRRLQDGHFGNQRFEKQYGTGETAVHALAGVNLSVENGEFVAVVGTSGSGKSTLLHMLGGLDRATSGKVYVDGKDIFALKDEELTIFRRRKIGFVFQSFNLVPVLSVYENIVLPLQLDGKTVDNAFIGEIAEALGLKEKLNVLPNQLSGGQQQRVAIARALAAKPAILLADEPTGNLDSRTSQDVMGLLKTTSTKFAQTIMMITHNEEIAQLADRIIRIEDGRIVTGKAGEAL